MTHTHEAMREAAESRQDRNVGDLRSMLRQALAMIEGLEGERDKWIEAFGTASTLAGDMEIDVDNPAAMAQEMCAYVADLRAQLKAKDERVAELEASYEDAHQEITSERGLLQAAESRNAELEGELARVREWALPSVHVIRRTAVDMDNGVIAAPIVGHCDTIIAALATPTEPETGPLEMDDRMEAFREGGEG